MEDNYGPSPLQAVFDNLPKVRKVAGIFGITMKQAAKSLTAFWNVYNAIGKTSRQIKKEHIECTIKHGIMRRAFFTHDGKDKRR